jgi:multiple sugar transport system permease protein
LGGSYSLATQNQQYGYAAAVSFVLGIVIAGASYIFTLITNRRRPEQ